MNNKTKMKKKKKKVSQYVTHGSLGLETDQHLLSFPAYSQIQYLCLIPAMSENIKPIDWKKE
jgi:hypothetical protein